MEIGDLRGMQEAVSEAVSEGRRAACIGKNGQFEINKVARDDVIKSRKLPDGIYIRGTVQANPLLFTADTGASKTIISRRMYESFKPEDRPK